MSYHLSPEKRLTPSLLQPPLSASFEGPPQTPTVFEAEFLEVSAPAGCSKLDTGPLQYTQIHYSADRPVQQLGTFQGKASALPPFKCPITLYSVCA